MSTLLNIKVISAELGPIPHQHDGLPAIARLKASGKWFSGYFNNRGDFFTDSDEIFHKSAIDYFFEIPDEEEMKNAQWKS